MNDSNKSSLRFNGSLWCNLDIALRNVDQIYSQGIEPLGLTVIEWYILRALYEQDGQHASELARAVGRAATSFTPILDKLQHKDLIQRKPDPADRRAVRIYLTDKAQQYRDRVQETADQIEKNIHGLIANGDYNTFQTVLSQLQDMASGQAE
ncbi:MAG TPA: MarR family transcriptional regulator [Phototrophicaceae bacterium]|nr:MarR family transcriptional regulator [Phototrophicaceae bacterium]